MQYTVSRDGTKIAYQRSGDGPPVILVVGAFNERSTGAPLADVLAERFTMITYDRRGRGDSGDTLPYAVDREIEDLDALIAEADGSAAVFGYSSGAMLALQAAAFGLHITRLALYEPPYGYPLASPHHTAHIAELIAAGRRGDAVEYYQAQVIGIPEQVVAQLRHAPFRPALERIAHTLVYESIILGEGVLPTALAAAVKIPTLMIAGGASFPFMAQTARALAAALGDGRAQILEGQTHDLVPSVLGPVLEEFYASDKEH
jgi:pimeloyl-ACP methyl ester carboxylesterase